MKLLKMIAKKLESSLQQNIEEPQKELKLLQKFYLEKKQIFIQKHTNKKIQHMDLIKIYILHQQLLGKLIPSAQIIL